MSKTKLKAYALHITVKPTGTRTHKFSPVPFKGIAIARNPNEAKELAINIVLNSFKEYDGSAVNRPLITRENFTVKECKPYADFFIKSE